MKLFRTLPNALMALIVLFAGSVTVRAQVETHVQQLLTAFTAGDNATALAAHSSATVSITDEFAPFHWEGPHAFSQWATGLAKHSAELGLTDQTVSLGPVDVKTELATRAYLVYPAIYSYKEKGVSTREPARMAFVLKKEGRSWKIASWTWTGTNPQPVK